MPRVSTLVPLLVLVACSSDADSPMDAGPDSPVTVTPDGRSSPVADARRTDGPAVSFTTTFDGTEAPISENGAWTHSGADWTLVDTGHGIAYGTQMGSPNYDDSYAYLSGFPPNQAASAVIHLDPAISHATTHEVEILLRWSDSAHDAHGYECNFAFDGSYVQIVRWNGPINSFTYLAGGGQPGGGSVPGGMHDGDTVSAQIVGDAITVFVNGAPVASTTDSTWTTGNPGMGFWRGSAAGLLLGDYGYTSYSATSL